MSDHQTVSVKILDHEYKIKCPPDQTAELRRAAESVDKQMRQLKRHSQTASLDNVAVVTALNFCHESLKLKREKTLLLEQLNERIDTLQQKLAKNLAKSEEVAV